MAKLLCFGLPPKLVRRGSASSDPGAPLRTPPLSCSPFFAFFFGGGFFFFRRGELGLCLRDGGAGVYPPSVMSSVGA